LILLVFYYHPYQSLANADFFSSVIPAVVTYLCPAMAYTAASVVAYIMEIKKSLRRYSQALFLFQLSVRE
jgi:hypothetical protein